MPDKTKLSVVVPFYNTKDTLKECLCSLLEQSYQDYEIIAVNNNSTDGSENIVKELIREKERVLLAGEKKQGPASARNTGVRRSSGEIIAFIDADCIADRDWLKDGVEAMQDEHICGIGGGGGVLPCTPSNIFEKFSSAFTTKSPPVKTYDRFDFVEGGGFPSLNLIIKKEFFLTVDGFNEDFHMASGEDFDLCARLYNMGYKLQSISSAKIYHKHRSSFKRMSKQAYQYGRTHPKILQDHFQGTVIVEVPILGDY